MMDLQTLKQDIFNKVWAGAKSQRFQRSVDGGCCVYRGPDGMKCNAGHLIPDDKYSAAMENKGIQNATVWQAIDFGGVNERTRGELIEFIRGLQLAHDNAPNAERHEWFLRQWAVEQGLNVPE